MGDIIFHFLSFMNSMSWIGSDKSLRKEKYRYISKRWHIKLEVLSRKVAGLVV
jgi:hypothetical protein